MDTMEEEIKILRKLMEEKENDVLLAAKYGKELLETNNVLHNKIDALSKEYSTKIKDLEQENYSLNQRLEVKTFTVQSQAAEIETLTDHLRKLEDENPRLSKDVDRKQKTISILEKKVVELNCDLDKVLLELNQVQEESKLLETQLTEMRVGMNGLMSSEVNDDDIHQLQELCNNNVIEKQQLESTLTAVKSEVDKLKFDYDRQQKHRINLERELEEKECQLSNCENAIDKLRQEKLELQVEMDAMKFDDIDVNKRGNSLFAEVEDKRQRLHAQLTNLKITYESLKRKYDINKSQLSRMKYQMFTLLDMSGNSKVDCSYITKLEQSLSKSQFDLQDMTFKVSELEQKVKVDSGATSNIDDEYFRVLLDKSKKEIEDIRKELKEVRFLKLAETDSLIDCQKRLHAADKSAESYKNECIKLKMKIDESKSERNSVGGESKIISEKIPGFVVTKTTESCAEPKDPPKFDVRRIQVESTDDRKSGDDENRKKVCFLNAASDVDIEKRPNSVDIERRPKRTGGKCIVAPVIRASDARIDDCNQQ
ncbi:Uncharacterised protein g6375 [Pycnogonum litorale]